MCRRPSRQAARESPLKLERDLDGDELLALAHRTFLAAVAILPWPSERLASETACSTSEPEAHITSDVFTYNLLFIGCLAALSDHLALPGRAFDSVFSAAGQRGWLARSYECGASAGVGGDGFAQAGPGVGIDAALHPEWGVAGGSRRVAGIREL